MTYDDAKQLLQRRLMVAQTSPVPDDAIDAIAALIVDAVNEATQPDLVALVGLKTNAITKILGRYAANSTDLNKLVGRPAPAGTKYVLLNEYHPFSIGEEIFIDDEGVGWHL